MSVLAIVLIALAATVIVLAAGGAVAAGRRRTEGSAACHEQVARANHALALAHAADNGWDRSAMEAAAARAAGDDVEVLDLVQVIDRPGTDADEAVFRAVGADGAAREVRLGRRGDEWFAAGA